MSFIKNHFDGRDLPLIEAQKQFKKEIDLTVEEIINELPEMLRPIIAERAEELVENAPDALKKPDSVTGDVMASAKAVYMRLLFSVSNQLGHGANWLK
ncbi:hypothetical protein [Escherichia coli]|uniref:hypothetical protein n=1 Tax=Escherichia coli TaxID=562 RepID=UPI00189F48B7|nr:hypothetical protein [Escherichia coli]QPE55695.1 hypothetical protein IMP96_00015 [Escherichia coli]QPE97015.1 hypothetical protein IMP23_00025 [Escherichia coli]